MGMSEASPASRQSNIAPPDDFPGIRERIIKIERGSPFKGGLDTTASRLLMSEGMGWIPASCDRRGMGLVAMTEMTRGHLIAHETVMVVDETLESMGGSIKDYNEMLAQRLKAVKNNQKFAHYFFGLGKGSEEKFGKLGAYFERNCIPCPLPSGRKVRVLGPWISIINHSCAPNAEQTLLETTIGGTKFSFVDIRACRKIMPGEEITVSYQDIYLTAAERKKFMDKKFGFECACKCCLHPNPHLEADFRFVKRKLPIVLSPAVGRTQPAKALKNAYHVLSRLMRNGIQDRRYPDILAYCARICAFHSDVGRVLAFLNTAQAAFYRTQGIDGPDLAKLLEIEANVELLTRNRDSLRGRSAIQEAQVVGVLDHEGCRIGFMLQVNDCDYLRLCDAKRSDRKSGAPGLLDDRASGNELPDLPALLQDLALEKKEHDEMRLRPRKEKSAQKKRRAQNKK
ncbi:predicted protein [Uncinocarpus reesii 1704]|uniref:SET domain-containing protein n=1 Tax=Uncinocarpus reesii (strain UAMH 1704) TaxID=336963 RepID=C4JEE3_UNCRE|nr:uncharacterized protein UREG_00782 [Uncinocarpus reesii 1704]EEP75935.1 predicted protein [Uncinocarpus reesii 1704]